MNLRRVGGCVAVLSLSLAPGLVAQDRGPRSGEPVGVVTGWHTVRPGETLMGITTRYLGAPDRWRDNWNLNPEVESPNVIVPGIRLRVILDFEKAPPIARLRTIAGKVEARPVPIPWNQAQVEDVLIERDGLRTYRQSSTELEFRDGTNLVLSEESLVFVRPSRQPSSGPRKRSVEIVEGQAEVQALVPGAPRTDVEILVGTATATATATQDGLAQTRARKSVDGTAQVMVYEGASQVRAAGASVDVPKGMGTAVPEDAPPSPPEELLPAPTQIAPEPASEWRYGDPWFAWEPIEAAASHTLEVCGDPSCGELVARHTGLSEARWRPEPLPAGDYFWRVTAVNHSGLDGFPSAPATFKILFTGQDSIGPSGTIDIDGRSVEREGTVYWAPQSRLVVEMADEQSGLDTWAAQVDGRQLAEDELSGPWSNGEHVARAIGVDRVGNLGETEPLRYTVDAAGPAIEIRLGDAALLAEKLGADAVPKRWERRKRKWIKSHAPRVEPRRAVWRPLATASDETPLADDYDRDQALKRRQRPASRVEVEGDGPEVLLFAAGRLDVGPERLVVRHGESVKLFDPQRDGPAPEGGQLVWIGARDEGTGEVVSMSVVTEERDGETYLVVESEDVFGNRRRVETRFQPLGS